MSAKTGITIQTEDNTEFIPLEGDELQNMAVLLPTLRQRAPRLSLQRASQLPEDRAMKTRIAVDQSDVAAFRASEFERLAELDFLKLLNVIAYLDILDFDRSTMRMSETNWILETVEDLLRMVRLEGPAGALAHGCGDALSHLARNYEAFDDYVGDARDTMATFPGLFQPPAPPKNEQSAGKSRAQLQAAKAAR